VAGALTGWPAGRSRDGGVDPIPLPGTAGRLLLCGKHFIGPDPQRAVDATGADVVVCLCEEHELAGRYPDYVSWLRTAPPGRVLWAPIPDLHAPQADDARALLASLRSALDRGSTLLMHCGAGIGRAGTIAAALLITMGMPREDAVALVASCRPMAGPEAGAQAQLLELLVADQRVPAAPPEPDV
jgi:rhodanese/phosphatase family protein